MKFDYCSVKDHIARLLSQPTLEKELEVSCRGIQVQDPSHDVWESALLNNFKWKNGTSFWEGNASGNELRLAFSLGIDWFSVFPSGSGKKQWSIGAMYLVCLSLPLHLRYHVHNICLLGVIPGPRKPSGRQIDSYLRYVVNDFIELWDTGVWFTRTSLCPLGRLVRGVVIPIVCDLDAVRNIAGFLPHSSRRFCSYCYLTSDEITNFNKETWHLRTSEEHRRQGLEWLSATPEDRAQVESNHGTTYTELMRLEYFQGVDFAVVDVMHNMLIGNLKRHCRQIWGMDVDVEGGDGALLVLPSLPSQEKLQEARQLLNASPSIRPLSKMYVDVLQALCIECGVTRQLEGITTKVKMLRALQQWVRFALKH
jgi:hypothetical protein